MTWGAWTGSEMGGSVVGDLLYTTGVFSVVESLIWQSILRDVSASSAAAGTGRHASPLVIDGGANVGQ